jgi:hypothetical protein
MPLQARRELGDFLMDWQHEQIIALKEVQARAMPH